MSKVMIVFEEGNEICMGALGDAICAGGHTVDLYRIVHNRECGDVSSPWSNLSKPETIQAAVDAGYDAIVINTHNGNPHVKQFQKQVTPRLGYFDVEHDLFSDAPETTRLEEKRLGTFAFHARHHAW